MSNSTYLDDEPPDLDDDPPEPTKPMAPLRAMLNWALVVFMAGQVANAAIAASYLALFQREGRTDPREPANYGFGKLLDILAPWVGWIFLATMAIGAFFYLWFVYRGVANVKKLSVRHVRDSPTGSVLWHFIPGVGWVKPFQIMRMLWVRSRDPVRGEGDGPPTGAAWWITWVALNFAGFVSAITQNATVESDEELLRILNQTYLFNLLGSLAAIASAVLLMPIIKGIAEAQDIADKAKEF